MILEVLPPRPELDGVDDAFVKPALWKTERPRVIVR